MNISLNIKSSFNFCGEFGSIDGLLTYNSNRWVKIIIDFSLMKFMASLRFQLDLEYTQILEPWWCLVSPVWHRILTVCPLSVRNKTRVGGNMLAFSEKQWGLPMDFHAFFLSVAVRSCTQNCTVLITGISSVPLSAEKVKQPWKILSLSQTVHLPFIVSQDLENCNLFSWLPRVTTWQYSSTTQSKLLFLTNMRYMGYGMP